MQLIVLISVTTNIKSKWKEKGWSLRFLVGKEKLEKTLVAQLVVQVDSQYLRVGKYMKNIITTGRILLISDKDSTFALLQNKSYTIGFSFKSSIIQLPYSKTSQGFPEECWILLSF